MSKFATETLSMKAVDLCEKINLLDLIWNVGYLSIMGDQLMAPLNISVQYCRDVWVVSLNRSLMMPRGFHAPSEFPVWDLTSKVFKIFLLIWNQIKPFSLTVHEGNRYSGS